MRKILYELCGCRVEGSGFRVKGSGFRVEGSGFRERDSGSGGTAVDTASPIPDSSCICNPLFLEDYEHESVGPLYCLPKGQRRRCH